MNQLTEYFGSRSKVWREESQKPEPRQIIQSIINVSKVHNLRSGTLSEKTYPPRSIQPWSGHT